MAEILPRGLVHQEVSSRDLSGRCFLESLCSNLAKRPLVKILCRDLVKRTGILLRDIYLIESLNRDLALRFSAGVFCGDLLQAPCADSLTEGSCTAASTQNLSRRSCTRSSTEISTKELAESYVVSPYLFFKFLATPFGVSCRDYFFVRQMLQCLFSNMCIVFNSKISS